MLLWFKNQKDKKKTKKTWKRYFIESWDDYVGTLFFGQGMTYLREYLYGAYVDYEGNPDLWDVFIDHEELICVGIGMFGIALFKIMYHGFLFVLNKATTVVKLMSGSSKIKEDDYFIVNI